MEETLKTDECKIVDKGPTIGVRHIQFLFISFVGFLMYSTRFGFSVSLVAMTQKYSSNPDIPYYNWTNKSFILSTFFWGYVITQIPVGILGTKFGVKNFMLGAVFANSLCMISIPTIAANFGSQGVMACRIIQGFSQGLVVPSVHGIIGKWAVPVERCRVYGFMSTGYTLGNVVGLGATGFICGSWAGWPLTFYLLPSTGFIWVILYYLYGAASPATHKTISKAELNYLQTILKPQDIYNVPVPYKKIFTSMPFWAQLTMALCSGWGFSIFTTEMPIYMDKVMKFNIQSNGVISALPSVFSLISINVVSVIADLLVKKNYLSVGQTRKLMTFLGSISCAILLLVFVYLPTDSSILSVVILIAANGFRYLNLGGYNINHLDLAPNFAATLMALINTCAEVFSLITPITIQYIVYDETDRSLWRIVFIIAVCLYIFSTCFYLIFASGEVQPWNYTPVEHRHSSFSKTEKPDVEKVLLT